MDFVDWRKVPDREKKQAEQLRGNSGRLGGRMYRDYIEEMIHEAQQRGEFDNLPGVGKPLNLDDNPYAGDKNLAYRLLKNNNELPPEVALVQEIERQREQLAKKLDPITSRYRELRARRIPPTRHEKHIFNESRARVAADYEEALRKLNKRILTLNISVPTAMHQPLIQVEKLLNEFNTTCPPFDL